MATTWVGIWKLCLKSINDFDKIGLKYYMKMQINQRRVWRYQRGNQNPHIEEEWTTQWPKEKGQKDKQRSTKHTYKTKDRVKRAPLRPEVNSGALEG